MDELLRYSLFNIAFTVLLFELLAIGICFSLIVAIKFIFTIKNHVDALARNRLTRLMILSAVNHQTTVSIPFYLQGFRTLLKTIHAVDTKITDQSWKELKDSLVKTYLLKQAKKWVYSVFWTKRFLSAQCLLLNPLFAKKEELSSLLNDSRLLIRVIAAQAIVKLDDQKLFEQVIFRLSKEEKLSRFSYRDFLIKIDDEKFEWIIEILKNSSDPAVSLACLDLLSRRTVKNIFSLILPFVYGPDRDCKLLAVKILKNIPSGMASDILFYCLKDRDWEIRVEALKALAHNRDIVQKEVERVEQLLHDPVWLVRLRAALTLKELGDSGYQILSKFNPEKEPKAYEICHYVLALPEF